MTVHYYPETGSLYIELLNVPSIESEEVHAGIVLDSDEPGRIVGIDIDHVSQHVDLSQVQVQSLPVAALAVAE